MILSFTKTILITLFLTTIQGNSQNSKNQFQAKTITPQDFDLIIGDWKGTLTYIDYSSNNPFTMPANVSVKLGESNRQLLLFVAYPNEPKANGKEKITISKSGYRLNKNKVISKQILPNGNIEIITEHQGKDNNKKAIIRNIYILGKHQFIIRKEVQFEESDKWLKRNEYNFTR